MATSNIKRETDKDLNYKTEYADGVILQLDTETGRLIFYQEDVEPDADGLVKDKRHIMLKFEVRLPIGILKRLVDNGAALLDIRQKSLYMVEGLEDEDVVKEWWHFNDELRVFAYDTNDFELNPYELRHLHDHWEALKIRVEAADKRLDEQQSEEDDTDGENQN